MREVVGVLLLILIPIFATWILARIFEGSPEEIQENTLAAEAQCSQWITEKLQLEVKGVGCLQSGLFKSWRCLANTSAGVFPLVCYPAIGSCSQG